MQDRHSLISSTSRRTFPCFLVVVLSLLAAWPAWSQVSATRQVSATTVAPTMFRPNTPKVVQNGAATLVGHYNPQQMLRLTLSLQAPHWAEEQEFLQQLQTKGSPEFLHYLSTEEWNARFSPSAADEQAVVNWAQSQGLTVTQRYPNRLLVDVIGAAGTIEKAFRVTINSYQSGNRSFYSNDRDPELPTDMTNILQAVIGLDNWMRMRPASRSVQEPAIPDYVPGPAVSAPASSGADGDHAALTRALKKSHSGISNITGGAYDPTDIYSSEAYDYNALQHLGHCCNPFGDPNSPPEASIAVVTVGSQNFSDIAGFHSQYPYLAYLVNEVGIDGQSVPCTDSTDNTCDGEGTLDMEWTTATANSFGSLHNTAHVFMYDVPNFNSIPDGYAHELSDGNARVGSTSWSCTEGGCPSGFISTLDTTFANMVGAGWTLIAAQGDRGATDNCADAIDVAFPGSDPYVVSAGGTTLRLNSSSIYVSEVTWTGGPDGCSSNDGGTGGGCSLAFSAPGYQSSPYCGSGSRSVPDIALNADWYHTPQNVYFDGLGGNGGTSIVAPELAGFFAQENAYLLALGSICGSGSSACAPVGDPHYLLYDEGRLQTAPHDPYYDITSGDNCNDVTSFFGLGCYFAGTGYDAVTGWGSANMLQLAWALNWWHIPGFSRPVVTFFGPATGKWYNTDQVVSWSISAPADNGYPSPGVSGFTQTWDSDPGNPLSEPTPGPSSPYNAFYDGPQYANRTSGCLDFTGASCAGSVGQGWHTVNVRAWGNEGENGGDYTYGPIGYDTVPPVTTDSLSGTKSGSTYISAVKVTLSASDPSPGSGVASTVYQVNGGTVTTYSGPFTVSTAGAITVTFHSTDVAGNVESTKSASFTITSSTTTGLSSSLNPAPSGKSVTFTATVTPALAGTPTGTVEFKNGATVLATKTLSGGKATYATSTLTVGSHSITAVYSGATDFTGSTSSTLKEVIENSTTTTLGSSKNPSEYGQSITLTATITKSGSGTLSGTVTFKNGAVTLGTGTVSGAGKATFATSALTVGTHALTAVYGGNSSFTGSTSPVFNQVVSKANSSTTVKSSLNPSTSGATVTFTATVKSSTSGTPAGTVTFKDGATTLGSHALSGGTAAFSTSKLATGTHTITAVYAGNADFNTSTSAGLHQVVNP